MKYLFGPEAVVPFLVYSTKFIQQSFIEYVSVPDLGLGADGPQRNEPQTLSMERSVSAGETSPMRPTPSTSPQTNNVPVSTS